MARYGFMMRTIIGMTKKNPGARRRRRAMKKIPTTIGNGEMAVLRRAGVSSEDVLPLLLLARGVFGGIVVGARKESKGEGEGPAPDVDLDTPDVDLDISDYLFD